MCQVTQLWNSWLNTISGHFKTKGQQFLKMTINAVLYGFSWFVLSISSAYWKRVCVSVILSLSNPEQTHVWARLHCKRTAVSKPRAAHLTLTENVLSCVTNWLSVQSCKSEFSRAWRNALPSPLHATRARCRRCNGPSVSSSWCAQLRSVGQGFRICIFLQSAALCDEHSPKLECVESAALRASVPPRWAIFTHPNQPAHIPTHTRARARSHIHRLAYILSVPRHTGT